jgi:Secretion system C-terminal sorting domain
MKKYILSVVILLTVAFISSSFYEQKAGLYHPKFRSGGAAAIFGAGYTGASFDAGACSNCHFGGTFGSSIDVQLLNASNIPVTSYTPGVSYNLRITLAASSGSPLWGFQTTSITGADINLNNWGAALPANTSNVFASGRNYVEQNARLNNGILNIPWTAPPSSSGSVTFYSIGNAVNGTGGTDGDNPTSTNTLIISEGILPVTLTTFKVEETNNGNKLYWETAQEINNNFFAVQHSTNGSDFTNIGKVIGNGTTSIAQKYSFYDKFSRFGTNFYRLAQTDFDGKINYSPIVKIQNKNSLSLITVSPNPVVNKIILKSNFALWGEKYSIINNQGATVLSGIFINNEIDIQKLAKGNYFIRIEQKSGDAITAQFVK